MAFSTPVLARNRAARQRNIAGNVAELLPIAAMTRNLLDTIDHVVDGEWDSGLTWYSGRAAQVCADIISAARAGGRAITFRQAAGILAALSPGTSWDDNCDGAIELAATGAGFYRQSDDNNAKALAILNGAEPLTVLGGRKVRSFFANILNPHTSGAVTIDRHALAILFGRPLSERELKVLARRGVYTVAAGIYRAVARIYGIRPLQLQAITWVAWRRLKGLDDRAEAF